MAIPPGNFSRRLMRRWGKGLGVLAIGLLGLVIWWFLNYREVTVLPEPFRVGNSMAIPVAPPQPALTEFPCKPVRDAASELKPDELVLGVEIGGEARAYPINMLSGPNREIFNDTLAGQAIAATWCDLCFSGIVYARQAGDQTLTLFVSGYLLDDSLVMQDQETKTYWSQVLGEAKAGPLKGKKLQQIPAVLTDWKSWSKHHPEGTVVVLSRHTESYRRDSFNPRDRFVLGVVVNEKAAAWRFDLMDKTPARNDRLGDTPVLVIFDQKSVAARLYDREVDGRALTFRLTDDRLTDQETGSTWDPAIGLAVVGPLKGKHLLPLPGFVCYYSTWKDFHPLSQIYSAE